MGRLGILETCISSPPRTDRYLRILNSEGRDIFTLERYLGKEQFIARRYLEKTLSPVRGDNVD